MTRTQVSVMIALGLAFAAGAGCDKEVKTGTSNERARYVPKMTSSLLPPGYEWIDFDETTLDIVQKRYPDVEFYPNTGELYVDEGFPPEAGRLTTVRFKFAEAQPHEDTAESASSSSDANGTRQLIEVWFRYSTWGRDVERGNLCQWLDTRYSRLASKASIPNREPLGRQGDGYYRWCVGLGDGREAMRITCRYDGKVLLKLRYRKEDDPMHKLCRAEVYGVDDRQIAEETPFKPRE